MAEGLDARLQQSSEGRKGCIFDDSWLFRGLGRYWLVLLARVGFSAWTTLQSTNVQVHSEEEELETVSIMGSLNIELRDVHTSTTLIHYLLSVVMCVSGRLQVSSSLIIISGFDILIMRCDLPSAPNV